MSKAKKAKFAERCRCCLKSGDLQSMWEKPAGEDKRETYGEMVAECFAISLQPTEHPELICRECVRQLWKACQFKKLIIASDEFLSDDANADHAYEWNLNAVRSVKGEIKSEIQEEDVENEQIIYLENDAKEEGELLGPDEYTEQSMSSQEDGPGVEYLEVDFLDEENVEVKNEPPVKRKWPKKKKKSERTRTYKKYTDEELKKAMHAVKSDVMSRAEAAEYFNVPCKTLGAKLRGEVNKLECPRSPTEEDELKQQKQEKYQKFVEEIQTILTYTNATPFKTKAGKYFCAYCSTEGPRFEKPEDLRTHVRTKHINDRLKDVEVFMRPYCLNEVIKVDINDLICSVCCVSVEGWNEMFQHLADKHEKILDQACTKVVPFKLNEELTCALCNEGYPSFCLLDGHMNAHYNNYICGECGDTFLAENRLRRHLDTHCVGKFICQFCGKVFSLDKYRKKHIDGVHGDAIKFKCRHCPEKFKLEYTRHLHEIADHGVKVQTMSCPVCDKVFDWRPYYLKHLRMQHTKTEKRHQCKLCDKQFKMPYELRNHENWHRGVNVCQMCGRSFSSKQYMMKHMRKHVGEIVSIRY